MRNSKNWARRHIAGCLVMFLVVPFAEAATALPQPAATSQQATGTSSASAPSQNPSSTAGTPATASNQAAAIPDDPDTARPQLVDRNQQSGTSSSSPDQQQNGASNPVGTAAAPYQKSTGIAASRPAGAVIAPAKQRRTRSFLIKVGIILGAAVAVGTVVGLSKGSPSRPN